MTRHAHITFTGFDEDEVVEGSTDQDEVILPETLLTSPAANYHGADTSPLVAECKWRATEPEPELESEMGQEQEPEAVPEAVEEGVFWRAVRERRNLTSESYK